VGNFLSNSLKPIQEYFKNLEKKSKIRLAILAVVIVAVGIAAAVLLGRTKYAVLYSNLSAQDAGSLYTTLTEMGIPVKTQGTGTILVPEKRATELRWTLAAQDFEPDALNLFSLFQENTGGLTGSDFETQAYWVFQQQANLRAAIRKMNKIEDCLVLIPVVKEDSFVMDRNTKEPSASVLLVLKGGEMLTAQESVAIAETVTAAVAGLKPENVRIVDSAMNLYPTIAGDESGSATLTEQLMMENTVRQQLEAQVIKLLTPVFGTGKVAASVAVTLDFDSEVSEAIEFAPPVEGETDGIVVSMSELYENARDGTIAEGVPGTDSNGMGSLEESAIQYPYGELGEGDIYSKVLREINYEINQTTTQVEKAKGTIKSLSIGVVIDSETIKQDYTENVKNLVSKAIGVSDAYVAVERLPIQFAEGDVITDALDTLERELNALKSNGIIRTALICATILILVLAALLLLRSIFRRSTGAAAGELALAGGPGGTIDYLAGDGLELDPDFFRQQTEEEEDIPLVGGQKPESVKQLEKMIKANPEAVASILRTWLTEE
jgi:flagellar M-ring protein FliF